MEANSSLLSIRTHSCKQASLNFWAVSSEKNPCDILRRQRTDLVFPDSITVDGFAPCGLFYTPIQLMTFFFPLWIVWHSLQFSRDTDDKNLQSQRRHTKPRVNLRWYQKYRGESFPKVLRNSHSADLTDFGRFSCVLRMRNAVWPPPEPANQIVRRFRCQLTVKFYSDPQWWHSDANVF